MSLRFFFERHSLTVVLLAARGLRGVGCGSDLGLEGSLQRAEGSWVWKQLRHAWHGWGVGGEELHRKKRRMENTEKTEEASETEICEGRKHAQNTKSRPQYTRQHSKSRIWILQWRYKLTFECRMNGLSSFGVYLSNWRKKRGKKNYGLETNSHIKELLKKISNTWSTSAAAYEQDKQLAWTGHAFH